MGEVTPGDSPLVLFDVVDGHMEVQLHTATTVAAAVGERLLASFYKCFVGLERMLTYEHLIYLNHLGEKQNEKNELVPPVDAHAFARNRRTLVFLMQGTLYEFAAALQEMCALKVIDKIGDRRVWEPIDKVRREWNTNKYASLWRNNFAHHLGELDHFVTGLRDPTTSGVVTLNVIGGGKFRHAGQFPAPLNTLFRGHDVQTEDVEAFAKKTLEAHTALPDQFLALFMEVMRTSGVELRSTDAARGVRAVRERSASGL